jgi:hypothetical protein
MRVQKRDVTKKTIEAVEAVETVEANETAVTPLPSIEEAIFKDKEEFSEYYDPTLTDPKNLDPIFDKVKLDENGWAERLVKIVSRIDKELKSIKGKNG